MSAKDRVTIDIYIDEAAGTDDDFHATMPYPGKWELEAATYSPATTTALDGTNYSTVSVTLAAAASAGATVSNQAQALTVASPVAFTLGGLSVREVDYLEDIKVGKVDSGTGAALDGMVQLAFIKLSA